MAILPLAMLDFILHSPPSQYSIDVIIPRAIFFFGDPSGFSATFYSLEGCHQTVASYLPVTWSPQYAPYFCCPFTWRHVHPAYILKSPYFFSFLIILPFASFSNSNFIFSLFHSPSSPFLTWVCTLSIGYS